MTPYLYFGATFPQGMSSRKKTRPIIERSTLQDTLDCLVKEGFDWGTQIALLHNKLWNKIQFFQEKKFQFHSKQN